MSIPGCSVFSIRSSVVLPEYGFTNYLLQMSKGIQDATVLIRQLSLTAQRNNINDSLPRKLRDWMVSELLVCFVAKLLKCRFARHWVIGC